LRRVAAGALGPATLATPSYDRRLAFLQLTAGHPQLYLMNADGTGATQVTFPTYDPLEELSAFGVGSPRWSPAA